MPRASAPFPWPGNKGGLADWILGIFPHHETYVDVFGGSGSLLFEKARSQVDVYNDADPDLVHFMETLRDSPDQLIERLQMVPYARELHNKWATQFFEGHRPDDAVERASRYYFIRRTQYGGEAAKKVGFRGVARGRRNPARQWKNSIGRLPDFADRLQDVALECLDYADLLTETDYVGQSTLVYCDPPYRDSTNRYQLQTDQTSTTGYSPPSFDFQTFVEMIADLATRPNGPYVVISTDVVPTQLDSLYQLSRDSSFAMNATDGCKETTEYLLANFNPDNVAVHTENTCLSAF